MKQTLLEDIERMNQISTFIDNKVGEKSEFEDLDEE
jgi:hypothetical protein